MSYHELTDSFGRRFQYLRLSITEKCNFRCTYCLPKGYQCRGATDFLSSEEIKNLAQAFVQLGTKKIRLSGGEPTLRSDILSVIADLKNLPQLDTVALTTNGFRLPQLLPDLKLAGLDAINISLDSLNSNTFEFLTGSKLGATVLNSIDLALKYNFQKIKINSVLLKNINDVEFESFIQWVQDRPIAVRFIELMQTSDNLSFFKQHHVSIEKFRFQLESMGWNKVSRLATSGPADEYQHPKYQGRIGFISPYSKDFCAGCNRLRVSAVGGLRLCLFGQGDFNLRPWLQAQQQNQELKRIICNSLQIKNKGHRLNENNCGDVASLSTIGG